MKQAQEALRIAKFSFQQGASSLLEVLDAQRVQREISWIMRRPAMTCPCRSARSSARWEDYCESTGSTDDISKRPMGLWHLLLAAMAGCNAPPPGTPRSKSSLRGRNRRSVHLTAEEMARAALEHSDRWCEESFEPPGFSRHGGAESSCFGRDHYAGARPGGGCVCGSRARSEGGRSVGDVVQQRTRHGTIVLSQGERQAVRGRAGRMSEPRYSWPRK